jgi:hypothetical protein
MYTGIDGSGKGWIQQMRNDSATAYDLILNPVGGNVGIGTSSPGAKLEVRSDAANPDYGVYFHNSGGGRVLKIYNTDWDAGDNLIYASNGGTATPSLGYEFVVTGNAKVHLTASDAYFEAAGAGGTPGTDSMLFGQNSTKVGYVWNRSTISTAHILFGTSSIERMRITAGGSVTIPLSTAGSVVQINTTSTAGTLNVGGKIFAAQNNSNTAAMRITRTVSISHGSNGGTFTYDFDPIAIWGFSATGGHVEINVAGWFQKLNAGFIQFQNAGSGQPLTDALFVQSAVSGSGTISVALVNPGVTNVIRITFTNWHSNAHAWNAWISSPKS